MKTGANRIWVIQNKLGGLVYKNINDYFYSRDLKKFTKFTYEQAIEIMKLIKP